MGQPGPKHSVPRRVATNEGHDRLRWCSSLATACALQPLVTPCSYGRLLRKPRAMPPLLLLALALLAGGAPSAEGGRVLGLFQLNAKSHFVMYEALLKELARRGHQVDVLSHFPQKTPLPNYRDLSVAGSLPDLVNNITVESAMDYGGSASSLMFFWVYNLHMCKEVYKHPAVQQLLRSEERYDLVVTEVFGVDCMMGFAHKFRAPLVNMVSSVLLPWANERVGNPDNPAYIPVYFLPFSPPLSFVQRAANALALVFLKLGSYVVADRPTDQMMRRHFGEELPAIGELQRNVSLVLVNSHFSLNQARPTVPAVVEVAGMHIQTPRPLPEKLRVWMDGAGAEGVVLFSWGSLVRAETLEEERLRGVVEELGALEQRVVWKLDAAALPPGLALPPNVFAAPWLPQSDILAHPKVRVFVTHGGLMGTQEAVHWGVPMVVVPFFGDQHLNARNYVWRGLAVQLDGTSFTRQQFRDALHTVLRDPSYRENAQRLSREFRDRPQTPLQTAVWWTEYVMRHKGAPQLRSAAVDLSWYQLQLLDVTAVLVAAAAVLLAALWLAARALAEWRRGLQDASRQPWSSISNGKVNQSVNGVAKSKKKTN